MRHLVSSAFLILLSIGCSAAPIGDVDDDEQLAKTSEALTYPSGIPRINFWAKPADLTVVALTFDDAPDPDGNTNRVLDILKTYGVKASFFVNSRNLMYLRSSTYAQAQVKRIVAEGHDLGNHTAHHWDLADPDTPVDLELSRMEWDVHTFLPGKTITLGRAPFGSPYESGPQDRLDYVAPIFARHAVHVAWSIDSLDWQCSTAYCITRRVFYRLDLGRRGPILLHSTLRPTVDALPTLIEGIRSRGLHFRTAEQLVYMKYGKSSYDLVQQYRATH